MNKIHDLVSVVLESLEERNVETTEDVVTDFFDEYIDSDHSYTYDLDLFGNKSLFHCINRSVTIFGKNRLAQYFKDAFHFKDQILDLLKGIGVVLPIQLIPLPFISTILLIVMEKTLLSMGIKILPSSFYES